MATPTFVEVDGSGTHAKTWVMEVKFREPPTREKVADILSHLAEKPFYFGIFQMADVKYMLFAQCHSGTILSGNCKNAVNNVFRKFGVEANLGCISTFNGYHMELFGFKPIQAVAGAKPRTPDRITPDDDEDEIEAELGDLTSKADNMTEFTRITTEYFKKREQYALAIRSESSNTFAPGIKWVTTPPPVIEVVTKRFVREWQKLEWILFRDLVINGDTSMRTAPALKHWPSFYALYSDISPVIEPRHCMREAFKTFSNHVLTATGLTIKREDLPLEDDERFPLCGKCFQCDAIIPSPGEMAGQIVTNLGQVVCRGIDDVKMVMDASRFGVFCSRRCARGRCHGCAKDLVDGVCGHCGDDQERNVRRAVPLGYGTNGEHSDEYVGTMEFYYAKRGYPLTWPGCRAKRECMFHTCLHTCERDCIHECTGCRVNNSGVKFGGPCCTCDPFWLQHQKPEELEPGYDVQDAINEIIIGIHTQPERPAKKPRV